MESQETYNQVDDDFRKICTTLLGIIHRKLELFEVGGFELLHPFETQNHHT